MTTLTREPLPDMTTATSTIVDPDRDRVLLEAYARSRSADAFAELARRYAGLVFATARRITRNAEDAMDVSQECFLELARRAGQIDAPLPAWLYRVACTRALNAVRNLATRRRHEAGAGTSPTSDRADDASWSDIEPLVDDAIAQLPPELRDALVLHFIEGCSQAEIAAVAGVNQSTISRRIQAGVESLRDALRARDVFASAPILVSGLGEIGRAPAPEALVSALGKMAAAGPAATAVATAGGVSIAMKLAAASLAVVVIATIAYVVLASSNQPSTWSTPVAATVPTSKVIDGVNVLAWGRGRDTTYLGALEAALAVTGPQHDYVTLMGDSALAFRVRWWRATNGPGWDPSSPVGEMPPWIGLVKQSTGWDMDWKIHLDGRSNMARYRADVVKSIDAGLPVLGYFQNMDMGVIYGYESGGDVVLVRDYSAGDAPLRVPLKANQGLLGFLTDRKDPPPRRDSIIRALQQAVKDGKGWVEDHPRREGPGAYHHGAGAYQVWIDDLRTVGKLPAEQLQQMVHPNYWTFDVLRDARRAAAKYLPRAAAEFDNPDARDALTRAAEHYARAVEIGDDAFRTGSAFQMPRNRNRADGWDDATRVREAETLTQFRDLDAAAIAEIETALKTIAK